MERSSLVRKASLGKHIGLFSCVMMIVGSIIGSGIFVSPKGILMSSGSIGMSLVIWLLCGVVSFLGSAIYIELGTCIPKSGSNFIYLKTAFGELFAFLYLWFSLTIQGPCGLTIVGLTFGNYILQPFFTNCSPPNGTTNIIAALAICLLTFINSYNIQWAIRVQGAFTVAKVLALIVIIIAGAYHLIKGNVQNFENVFRDTTTEPGYIVLAFYSGLFAYGGWNSLNMITEELINPLVNIPRAAFISLSLVTVIYLLANVAYFAVLSPYDVMSSDAVAVTFGDRILGVMAWIMPVSVAFSTFGNLNGSLFSMARLVFVGSREGHLPKFLSMININYSTPTTSLVFLCMCSMIYISTNKVYSLINYVVFADSIFNTLAVAGLIWLRYKEPNMERPIKVNIILPIAYFLICLFLVALPIYVSPWETGMSAAILLSGIPVYYATVFWESKPKVCSQFWGKVTYVVQMLTMSVAEERTMKEKEPKGEVNCYVIYSS